MPGNEKIVTTLMAKKNRLVELLDKRGGRGVKLANEIDRLNHAIDALQGELFCPHCSARLTSGIHQA